MTRYIVNTQKLFVLGFISRIKRIVKNHVKITKNEHEEVSHPIIKLT